MLLVTQGGLLDFRIGLSICRTEGKGDQGPGGTADISSETLQKKSESLL